MKIVVFLAILAVTIGAAIIGAATIGAATTALASGAADPFTGTWREKIGTEKFSGRPQRYTLNSGVYRCATCIPAPFEVKADGQDHKIAGVPEFDTGNVRVIDDRTMELTLKKNGKDFYTERDTVSRDGNGLVQEIKVMVEGGQPATLENIFTRVGGGPASSHALSGSWQQAKMAKASDSSLLTTFEASDTELKMSSPVGLSYEARFDGKEYPITGDPRHMTVMLKRFNHDEIQETDKQNGKDVVIWRMSVLPDGRTMHVVVTDKRNDSVESFDMEKQQ